MEWKQQQSKPGLTLLEVTPLTHTLGMSVRMNLWGDFLTLMCISRLWRAATRKAVAPTSPYLRGLHVECLMQL